MNISNCRRTRHGRARAAIGGLALTLAGAYLSTASAAEVTGFARGETSQPYPINGVPLLDSFHFRFFQHEMNVEDVVVLPASPIPPCNGCLDVPEGQIILGIFDHLATLEEEDEYFFRISHADLPASVFRHRISEICRGSCGQWLNRPSRDSVFVITGFRFHFTHGDHHLKRVAIWEENGALTVHFADDNGDDQFRYELEYVYLPPEMIPIRGHVAGVGARGSARATIDLGPVTPGPTVLRGFDLIFQKEVNDWGDDKEDQEIREIGVRTPANRVEVFFANDKGSAFDWGVDWGALSRLPIFVPNPPRAP